jgi:hypothetical protein
MLIFFAPVTLYDRILTINASLGPSIGVSNGSVNRNDRDA